MSLGSTYNNNQNTNRSNTPDVSVYSNYRMNNAESQIDATCLASRFWRGSLCLSIYPRKNTGNDEVSFDTDNGITIYLSHTKARILRDEIKNFLKDPVTFNGVGVPSGQGVITISNGVEYGKNTPVLTIRKVNETGAVVASFAYEFKSNYYFSIRNYDGGKTFDSVYDDYRTIEVEQLITLLDEYIKASTNAVAFTVMDQRKFSATRFENKLDAIAQSLGVEVPKSGGNQRRYNNNSYFNSNNANGGNAYPSSSSVSYGSATIEDLE